MCICIGFHRVNFGLLQYPVVQVTEFAETQSQKETSVI